MIISIDEYKKIIPGYSPERAEQFHSQSAKIANKEFEKVLKVYSGKEVILLNGGSASGKSEYALTHLDNPDILIFDSTLSSLEGAKIKINKILKANKTPLIYSVIPDDLKRAFVAFLHRDRKFGDNHFYRTHTQARKILLDMLNYYPKIKVIIIESFYKKTQNKDKMDFKQLTFDDINSYHEYLRKIQIVESDIIKLVNS